MRPPFAGRGPRQEGLGPPPADSGEDVELASEGVDDELETLEIDLLLTGIARRWGYDFRDYAPASLRRRVRRAVRIEGAGSVPRLQERVLRDPEAFQRFISCLSVQVTGMFRDPQVFRALRSQVLPMLRTYPFVRIWDAGCSTGEEAYSLAILLAEEGMLEKSRIYATDLSDNLLHRARAGVMPLRDMRAHTAAYHRAGGRRDFSEYYTADHQHALLREDLRRAIVFSQHNLAHDSSFNEFQLILCRNVMIYFDQPLRERVHKLLYESLVTFGVLAVGVKETLRFTPYAERYEALSEPLGLYRRVR